MKILITGFDPFNNEKINPSWEAVKQLPNKLEDIEIIKLQLPTEFKKSTEVLFENIKNISPDFVLCVGQAGGRYDFSIERVAINIDDARIPDNSGFQPIDTTIFEDGKTAYFSSLPIKGILKTINENNIPGSISNTAGTFVCNHIMYSLLYYIKKNNLNTKGGFIHIPYIREQILNKKSTPFMELSTVVEALKLTILAINNYKEDIKLIGGLEF